MSQNETSYNETLAKAYEALDTVNHQIMSLRAAREKRPFDKDPKELDDTLRAYMNLGRELRELIGKAIISSKS